MFKVAFGDLRRPKACLDSSRVCKDSSVFKLLGGSVTDVAWIFLTRARGVAADCLGSSFKTSFWWRRENPLRQTPKVDLRTPDNHLESLRISTE